MDKGLRDRVKARANGVCEYCGVPNAVDTLPFQVDHVIAEKHGGPTSLENLAWSCFDCNLYKGPNIAGVDPLSGQITRPFHPREHAWRDHFDVANGELVAKSAEARTTVEVLRINLPRRVMLRRELALEGIRLGPPVEDA